MAVSAMQIFLAELIGTAILIILGDGVCCNVSLNKSGQKGGGSVQTGFAWGLAVLLPAFVFGATSGAHFNPAVTIALAVAGSVSWSMVPVYLAGEFLGAFLGAAILVVLFYDQFKATEDPNVKRGCFCTSPSVRNTPLNFLSEFVCGFLLLFTILGEGQVAGAAGSGVNYLLTYGIIVSIGMSLGGLTGYAMNPARDFGPRLAYAILPVPGKGDPDMKYAWIPIVAPVLGGVVAALLYYALPLAL